VTKRHALHILLLLAVLLPPLACDVVVPGSEMVATATAYAEEATPTAVILAGVATATDTPQPPAATPIPFKPTDTPLPPPPTPPLLPTAVETPGGPPVVGVMADIPAGPFTMGSDKGGPDETPVHQVDLPAYQIDKFEVTNADFARFAEATGYKTDLERAGGQSWRDFAEGKDNHPVVKVTWNDAKAFCEWAGKRLPTEAEWEKAARGTDGRSYPWGNDWDPKKANVKEASLRGTTAVGSFAAGASPYGVMDMAGNVGEWMADWYQPYPGSTYKDPYFGEKFKVTRGGGWFDEAAQVRTTSRNAADPAKTANDDLGFRCAR
jgi:formylglycine-generating enzyme required for sulfatase activity